MAIRTNATDVKAILLQDYDSLETPSLVPFITTASLVTDRLSAQASAASLTLTSSELQMIEAWLSAHFYAQSDKPYQEKSTERAKAIYVGQTRMRLESTLYGQTAMVLDHTGLLSGINSGKRASAFWLGKVEDDWTEYSQRVS